MTVLRLRRAFAKARPEMRYQELSIPGPLLVTPTVHGDSRGWFAETFREAEFAERTGVRFVQDNQSFSAAKGTLRGLHGQTPPRAQAKLVRCLSGRLLDVALDARVGSPTYGQWVSEELSAENHAQLFVPAGFLHGFLTLTPDCTVAYKVSDIYSKAHDFSVAWNSAGVDWGIDSPILSQKDSDAPNFADWDSPFTYEPAS